MFAVAHEPALRSANPRIGAPLPPSTGNRPSAPPAATAPSRSRPPTQPSGAPTPAGLPTPRHRTTALAR
jgi:hypothetical protein